jgi:mRNA interferase HigB
MELLNEKVIFRLMRRHPDAVSWLENWLEVTRDSTWTTIQEVKRAFPAVDGGVKVSSGGSVTVFDVSGNKYRMIVAINYQYQLVRVFELPTHGEYSKNLWKERY